MAQYMNVAPRNTYFIKKIQKSLNEDVPVIVSRSRRVNWFRFLTLYVAFAH